MEGKRKGGKIAITQAGDITKYQQTGIEDLVLWEEGKIQSVRGHRILN